MTQAWDKTFPKSEKVEHQKVTFHNRYGIELAADMYTPKNAEGRLAAIAVSGPFGAVKEQSSGLYAQHMAERGFLTIAFDPSFTGESGGEPRRMASPDINTEDFLAAVDFLSTQANVDADRIGIIGICGFGGMAVNAAAIDPRIKATVASTMYDMSKVNVEGYFKSEDTPTQRMEKRRAIAAQRTEDYKTGTYKRAGGVVDPLPEDAPWFVKDYYDYYKTARGYHERSGNSNDGWNVIGCQSFLNQPLLAWAQEIETPVLLIHGEKAHSRYFSEYAFERMTGKQVEGTSAVEGNKELLIIPEATHVDLYDDKANMIPFDKIETFFRENLSIITSKIQVKSVTKSPNWGNEDAVGNVRYFAVVRYTNATNKFAGGAIGTNSDYPLSYDLQAIYGADEEHHDKHGDFDGDSAYKAFLKDVQEDDIKEGLNLYTIGLPFVVKTTDGQPFAEIRQAFYGNEEEAREYVNAAIKRDLARGRLIRVEPDDAEGEGEE